MGLEGDGEEEGQGERRERGAEDTAEGEDEEGEEGDGQQRERQPHEGGRSGRPDGRREKERGVGLVRGAQEMWRTMWDVSESAVWSMNGDCQR